jgi:hypothetical protein
MSVCKRICTICGKEYNPHSARQTKTCGSKKCQDEYSRVKSREWERSKNRDTRRIAGSVQICSECGKKFIADGTISITCSPECKRKRIKKLAQKRYRRSLSLRDAKIWAQWDCEFFNNLDFTPGCSGPADPQYSPMEQHVGPIQWEPKELRKCVNI